MKKLHLLILLPLLVGLLFSCQKEQEPISSKIDQAQLEKSQQIIRQIEGFDSKLNSNLKSGETITVDSLVWYTEALENYNNARPDLQYENFAVSKTTYTAALDNGSLSMQDASALFNTIQSDLETELANLNPTDDKLKLTDVVLDSIEGNTAYLSANRVFGIGISAMYDAFDEDDDWIWGTVRQEDGTPPVGKCDGTMVGISDGSDELVRRLNNPNFAFDQQFVIVDVVTIEDISGIEWKDDNGDPLLFIIHDEQPEYSWEYCLINEELTQQLTNVHSILYSYIGQGGVRPQGLELSNVIIRDEFMSWNFRSHLLHMYDATYGTKILRPIED